MAKVGFLVTVLALLGCGCGTEKVQRTNTCDDSLKKCVNILGEKHKEQCYQTYHACITKGCK